MRGRKGRELKIEMEKRIENQKYKKNRTLYIKNKNRRVMAWHDEM